MKKTLQKIVLTISSKSPSITEMHERKAEIARILATGLLRLNKSQTDAAAAKTEVSQRKTVSPDISTTSATDFLTEHDLARRWVCSTSRLQRWRASGDGPAFLKLGRKILYRLQDIQAYEQACLSVRT